jgi:hypothetical protein
MADILVHEILDTCVIIAFNIIKSSRLPNILGKKITEKYLPKPLRIPNKLLY